MKSKVNALMILALCGMLAGCNATKYGTIGEGDTPYSQLVGRTSKLSYDTLAVSGIGSLNYLSSSEAADAGHFANFIDGLVTHNEFGILVLNLAESATHDADYKEFTFRLRSDKHIVWSNYKGQPYKYNGQVQYVKASDFVSGAKAVSTFSTGSNTFYLVRDFVSGAAEYYLYTRILDGKAKGNKQFTNLKTNDQMANWIQTQLSTDANYRTAYTAGGYADNPLKGSDIPNIANGSRFGVQANDEERTVKYTLLNSSMYFPTMLTYSPYLPVNQHFLDEKGSAFGVAKVDAILYNGPFILNKMDETKIIYKKNAEYVQREALEGFQKPRVDTVKINLVKANIDATYIRNQFENGRIDGFSLDPSDSVGWKKYVTGADGSGDKENPVNGLVNSRLLDTIGSCYGTNIVMERTKNATSKKSYSNSSTTTSVANTEKALRLEDVRKAIMASFDYTEYYSRKNPDGKNPDLATQNLVHTYVPKNFVYDDNGEEYTDYYYAQALATKRGITLDEARAQIEVGQYATREKSDEAVAEYVDKALAAVSAYNDSAVAAQEGYGQIALPIIIEYYSPWFDQESKLYDTSMINEMNRRLNKLAEQATSDTQLQYFKVVPTDKITESNYEDVSGSNGGHAAFDFAAVQWGWGADYGDPLTYMNTYTKNGDWGGVFDFIGYDYVPNIKVEGNTVTESDLLAHYTEIVRDGAEINDNLTDRYTKFAEAEVELIEDLAIYMPQVNYGQGWSLSVSKSAGYEMPTANYGLSSDRLTGMWILKDPLTRVERQEIRDEYEAKKAEYKESHPAIDIYGE